MVVAIGTFCVLFYETTILPAADFSIFPNFNNKGSTSSSTAFSFIQS